MPDESLIERIWYGDDALGAALRLTLLPFELVFRAAVAARNAAYDAGVLSVAESVLPSVSVGNLTVGGTGKTPVAAWLAARLAAAGAHPAIVLRGYGDDEPEVHRVLNPELPVVVAPDRVAGGRAARERGADVVVLDDAFQHRRAARDADLLLVSADRWRRSAHLLPAGPWREPPRSARRATMIAITRKAASDDRVADVDDALGHIAPDVPRAVIALAPDELRQVGADVRQPIRALAGKRVNAMVSIGDPTAFRLQMERAGAVVSARVYPDHHAYSDEDVREFAAGASAADLCVCTLKDAVKLARRWPREAPPLWYVSQHVIVERGAPALERLVDSIVRARQRVTPTAG